jgi:hypothetical protein
MTVAEAIRKTVDEEYVYMLRHIRRCWREGRKVADRFERIHLPEAPLEVTSGPKGPYSCWEILLKTDDEDLRRQFQFALLEALDGDGKTVFREKLGWGSDERPVRWELSTPLTHIGYLSIVNGKKLKCQRVQVGTEPVYDWVCNLS